MFQFPELSSYRLCIGLWMMCFFSHRVPPFGYPRIVVYLRLPEAFRSLLRPSSALYAKAFTVRPFSFNHPCHQIEIFDGLFLFFKNCCFTICLFYLLHDLEIFFLFTTLFGKTFNIFLSVSFFSIIQFSKNERLSLEKSSRSLKTKQKSYSKLLFTCVFLSP